MGHAHSFDELDIYILARRLAKRIYVLTLDFPKEEKYSLTDQIRRSSRSVGAQIAEAWAKRKYEKHFVSKLSDADGEQYETRHWIFSALDAGIISNEVADELLSQYKILGQKLQRTMDKAHLFCKSS